MNLLAESLGAGLPHQNLDAGLVFVVPPPLAVIDPHDGLKSGEQIGLGHEGENLLADDRGAPEPAAGENAEAGLALLVAGHIDSDVMHLNGGLIHLSPAHGDLELARQIGELRVEG